MGQIRACEDLDFAVVDCQPFIASRGRSSCAPRQVVDPVDVHECEIALYGNFGEYPVRDFDQPI